MKSAVKLICALALTLLWTVTPAFADVPTEMSVQGRLTNGAGAPVPAGLKNFTFKIYDQPVGGVEIWPAGPGELQTLTTDANGLWNAGVGEIIPLTEAVFQSPVRWLEVTVNDGVNPIETLPRIELRTNPYTYRAATSQHADSLDNATYADLVDQFVEEAADTMSGQLRIDWNHANDAEPNLEIDNLSNAYAPPWNPFGGTWAAVSNAHSDNGSFNVALAGSAQGDNTANQGVIGVTKGDNCVNWGLFGSAIGTGSNNYGVYAEAVGGTSDFAGYFAGPLGVTTTPGDQSVQLPTDAISSIEILNEPGLASENNQSVGALSGTMSDIQTITITTPAAGYIRVQANVYCWISGAAGDDAVGILQIDESAGGSFVGPYYRLVGEYTKDADNSFHPVCVERIYSKAAGTWTFRVEGVLNSVSGSGAVNYYGPIVTATYYPTSYGTVAAVVATSDVHEFQQADAISVTKATGGLENSALSEPGFKVDLRELELKAARATAEAEKARRELVEAQVSALHRSGQTPIATGGQRP